MAEVTVIALESGEFGFRVTEAKRGDRRALVRVALESQVRVPMGLECPGGQLVGAEATLGCGDGPTQMWVSLPRVVELPVAEAAVVFTGLRVVLAEVGGVVRPIVRADGVREVASGVAA